MNAIKEAHYNLGIAYLEAGQYNRAVPEFEAAIKLDPDFIGAHSALCRAYLEQDELENAGAAVATALKLDANYQPALLLYGTIIEAYHDRGKAHLDEKRYTEAVAAFLKAVALAADLDNNSQDSHPENTHIYVHLGAAYIGMKAYQEAIEALQLAIAKDADLVDAHYNLGYAYVEQGVSDEAIPHLERAIAIAPHLKRAHYNLARAYRESGNLEAATNAITETLRLDPNYQRALELADTIKQAHYNRGITHLNDERYSEAVTAFQNAITLDSDFAAAHYNLGLAYLKMEAYPRAVPSLEKTVALDPNHKAAYHALALAYLGQQALGKARDAAREALKIDANYQPVHSLLEAIDPSYKPPAIADTRPSETDPQPDTKSRQQMHYELGAAYLDSKTPKSTDPPDAKRDLERGLVFLNSRQYEQAAAAFKRVIKVDASSVEAHYGLGQAYLEIGAFDDAKAAADTVLMLNPNHQKARELIQVIQFASNIEKNRKIRKKVLPYAVILAIIVVGIFVEMKYEIIPWPNKNLNLSITEITLKDPSRNGFLDAGETANLTLSIQNNGDTARDIEVRVQPASIPGVDFKNFVLLQKLKKNTGETIRVSMTADKNVKGRKQPLQIQLFGRSGWFGKKEPLTIKDFSIKIIPDTPDPIPPRRR